jgi:hypothetical protein
MLCPPICKLRLPVRMAGLPVVRPLLCMARLPVVPPVCMVGLPVVARVLYDWTAWHAPCLYVRVVCCSLYLYGCAPCSVWLGCLACPLSLCQGCLFVPSIYTTVPPVTYDWAAWRALYLYDWAAWRAPCLYGLYRML